MLGKRSCFLRMSAALVLVGFGQVQAQPPPGPTVPVPRLLYVTPSGGQAGSTFSVNVTGQDLDSPDGLHFNFPGVKVESLGRTTNPKPDPKGKPLPPAVTFKFNVTLPPEAPVGIQDIRVVNRWGISNPRAFVVGDLKEFVEQEPNDDVPQAQ